MSVYEIGILFYIYSCVRNTRLCLCVCVCVVGGRLKFIIVAIQIPESNFEN